MTDIMIEQILNHIKDYTGDINELCEKTIIEADAKGDEFELPIERYAAFNTQVYYSEKESYIIVSHLQYCLLDLIMNNVDVTSELLKLRYINLLENIMQPNVYTRSMKTTGLICQSLRQFTIYFTIVRRQYLRFAN
jgi:hypothetical protein